MRIDVEDALMMLAPCEGCGRTDCLWCRMAWQASVDGYIDDDAFIDCGRMKEVFMKIAKEKEA